MVLYQKMAYTFKGECVRRRYDVEGTAKREYGEQVLYVCIERERAMEGNAVRVRQNK